MRAVFIKFSNSRNRANAIKTVIYKDGSDSFVKKMPMTRESKGTLHEIYDKRELLNSAYPNCVVCPCSIQEDGLVFDYIKGSALYHRYWEAFQENDSEMFFQNIDRHIALLFDNTENRSFFAPSKEFVKLFGDYECYQGLDALKITNFEATAFNIIDQVNGRPVLFDYECVYDFPMPIDLVKYHCVYRTLYLCMPFLRSFVKTDIFLKYLGLYKKSRRLESSWRIWREQFSFNQAVGKETITIASLKNGFVKNTYEISGLRGVLAISGQKAALKLKMKQICPPPIYGLLKKLYRGIKNDKGRV